MRAYNAFFLEKDMGVVSRELCLIVHEIYFA